MKSTRGAAARRLVSAALVGAVVATTFAAQVATASRSAAAPAAVGQGFTVTKGDLAYILKQIDIAERHASTRTADNPCGTLVGPAVDQVPDRLTSYGLRTVDGSCNNLSRDGTGTAPPTASSRG